MEFYASLLRSLSTRNILVLAAGFVLVVAAASADRRAEWLFFTTSAFAFGFALVAWLPNWLVASNPLVMVDHFLWGLFGICAALTGTGVLVARRLRALPGLVTRA
jgi:hypothetical protein